VPGAVVYIRVSLPSSQSKPTTFLPRSTTARVAEDINSDLPYFHLR